MSFQEFQFSKVALLSVRWKAHTALCYTEHAAQAGSTPVCAAFAPGSGSAVGGRLPSPSCGGSHSPGKAALESGGCHLCLCGRFFSLKPRGPRTQSLRPADLLSQASRGHAQNPCVQSSTAWLLFSQAPFPLSSGEEREEGAAFLVFQTVHLGFAASLSFVRLTALTVCIFSFTSPLILLFFKTSYI